MEFSSHGRSVRSGIFGQGVNCRKATYAASMSPICLDAAEKKVLPSLLRDFNAISVREAELAKTLHPFTGKEVHGVRSSIAIEEKGVGEKVCANFNETPLCALL